MSFTYTYFKQDQYLLFVHAGELNDVSVNDFLEKGICTVVDHHVYKMINDYRNVELHLSASKLIDVQRLVSEGFLAKGVDPRKISRALVITEDGDTQGYYNIFETINLNHGLRVKLFVDMDQAVQWIKAQ
jgi:hypothetical protein